MPVFYYSAFWLEETVYLEFDLIAMIDGGLAGCPETFERRHLS